MASEIELISAVRGQVLAKRGLRDHTQAVCGATPFGGDEMLRVADVDTNGPS